WYRSSAASEVTADSGIARQPPFISRRQAQHPQQAPPPAGTVSSRRRAVDGGHLPPQDIQRTVTIKNGNVRSQGQVAPGEQPCTVCAISTACQRGAFLRCQAVPVAPQFAESPTRLGFLSNIPPRIHGGPPRNNVTPRRIAAAGR